MKPNLYLCSLIAALSFAACTSKESKSLDEEKIKYETAAHYFVKNNVTGAVSNPVTSQADFDWIFGPAATMANDGKPTEIDFSKNFVVAVIDSLTDKKVDLIPVAVEKEHDTLVVKYRKSIGEPRSYRAQPNLIFIIGKENEAPVKTVELP